MSTTQPPAGRATRSGEGAARVAQSALLREVPATVTAGRLATRYVSATAEARVGGRLLEIVSDKGRLRWLIGDTRGQGTRRSGWPVSQCPASGSPAPCPVRTVQISAATS